MFPRVITRSPVNGIAVNNGDGTVTFIPSSNYAGADNFLYSVEDDQAWCQTRVS